MSIRFDVVQCVFYGSQALLRGLLTVQEVCYLFSSSCEKLTLAAEIRLVYRPPKAKSAISILDWHLLLGDKENGSSIVIRADMEKNVNSLNDPNELFCEKDNRFDNTGLLME